MLALLRRSLPDTPLPSLKDALRTSIAIGVAVLLTGVFSAWLAPAGLAPVLVASMGASAIILLVLPTSPLAQPWPLVGGQIISFMIGISVARWISWPLAACGLAMLLSAIAMLRLHCQRNIPLFTAYSAGWIALLSCLARRSRFPLNNQRGTHGGYCASINCEPCR